MAIQTKTTLKSFFNLGDIPSESNFADLIDTLVNYDPSGKVGIGMSPGYDLDVLGIINATVGLKINGVDVGISHDSYWDPIGGNIYYSAGNVGIGTTNPLTALHTVGTITSDILHLASRADGHFGVNIQAIDNGVDGHTLAFNTRQTSTGAYTQSFTLLNSGNVGIGTPTPNANAILDITSTTKAFMPPRMTTVQILAIPSPTEGMMCYDLTLHKMSYYNNTIWVVV
jgi:hypothetical protein